MQTKLLRQLKLETWFLFFLETCYDETKRILSVHYIKWIQEDKLEKKSKFSAYFGAEKQLKIAKFPTVIFHETFHELLKGNNISLYFKHK